MSKSAYFSDRALKTFNRFGDILVPKNGDFPGFSEYGGLEHVDKIVAYAPAEDIESLNTLLHILSFMPNFVLRFVLKLTGSAEQKTGFIFTLLRQLNLAIKGIVFSSYYAERSGSNYDGKEPVDVIGYKINKVVD